MLKKVFSLFLIFHSYLPADNYDKLFSKYGQTNHLPPILLWAIAKQESGFNPQALNHNTNSTVDIGIMQINSVHEKWLNTESISLEDLKNPEINIKVGARILAKCRDKYGLNWKMLNCYNGKIESNDYNIKVLNHLRNNHSKKGNASYQIIK